MLDEVRQNLTGVEVGSWEIPELKVSCVLGGPGWVFGSSVPRPEFDPSSDSC